MLNLGDRIEVLDGPDVPSNIVGKQGVVVRVYLASLMVGVQLDDVERGFRQPWSLYPHEVRLVEEATA